MNLMMVLWLQVSFEDYVGIQIPFLEKTIWCMAMVDLHDTSTSFEKNKYCREKPYVKRVMRE